MSIFSDNCLAYLKAGYSVTPAYGKKPLIKGWQEYGKKQPTKEDIDEWCSKYPKANIDIVLGESSGVIVLDFDETDPEIIKIIEPLLPPSPVERIGKKGFARFFQYNGEPTQSVFIKDPSAKSGKRIVLEVLSSGKKVTIPPSIHPDTKKPYKWTGKTLLELDVAELPKFPPFLVSHVQSKLQFLESTSYGGESEKITEGRNISLSTHLGKLIKEPHTIPSMVTELIEFDKNNHTKPLFSDREEQDTDKTEYNALIFYLNHVKSINSKRLREGLELEMPIMANDLQVFQTMLKNDDSKALTALPKPTGLMKDIYDHILAKSYIEQPVFAMVAAMSLIGTLASRKLVFQGVTPNMYLLNIGESGTGKDACQQVIKGLLYDVKAGGLLGATSYPSEASIIQTLSERPTRLDLIDEASTFLSAATKGGNSYAVGIGDTLCELFSCSNSHYLGKSLASSNTAIGAVHRPHINLLCSTTPRGVQESISITSLEKGLFARFLVFFGDNDKEGKRVHKDPIPDENMLAHLGRWFDFVNPRVTMKGNLSRYNMPAYKVPLTRTANDLLTKYHREFDTMRINCKSSGHDRPIISRLYQHMLKIVLISAISNTELDKLPVVKPHDVEFGYQLINYYYDRVTGFISENLYESPRELKVNKVLSVIKQAGSEGLTNAELANQCKFLNTSERVDIIKDLKEANKVIIQQDEDNPSGYRFYFIGKEQ